MSLLPPNFNQPPLIAASGVVAAALLPIFQDTALSLSTIQLLQVAAYSLNIFATSQPGRLDGPQQDSMTSKSTRDGTKDQTMSQAGALSTGRRGRTLLAPKGWAFIIWAPIFAGELVYTVASCFVKENDAQLIRKTSSGFIIAQVFQALWAASFRPKYKGAYSFVSFAMLSGIAASLNGPHAAICRYEAQSLSTYALYGLPLSMHFGWTTAASLVNLNGCIAMMENSSPKLITAVGHASAVAATTLGVVVTLSRGAPVYGGVIAWALLACADGMSDRLSETKDQDAKAAGVYGARVQKWLCRIGAGVVAASSIVATVRL